jgi:hypothetical protein
MDEDLQSMTHDLKLSFLYKRIVLDDKQLNSRKNRQIFLRSKRSSQVCTFSRLESEAEH